MSKSRRVPAPGACGTGRRVSDLLRRAALAVRCGRRRCCEEAYMGAFQNRQRLFSKNVTENLLSFEKREKSLSNQSFTQTERAAAPRAPTRRLPDIRGVVTGATAQMRVIQPLERPDSG